MAGTLPTFPCDGCSATFGGGAKGAGHLHVEAMAEAWDVTIAAVNFSANQTGRVVYQEMGTPYCPALGQAAGTVTLTDPWAEGTVTRTGAPTDVGQLDKVTLTLGFTYQRAGATVVIALTTASIRADFHSIRQSGSITATSIGLAGAATGIFTVGDPTLVANRCDDPGPLPFSLEGVASVSVPQPPRTGGEYKDEDGLIYAVGTGGQDEGGRLVCASAGGWTHDCIVGVTTTGPSSNNDLSVSGTGPANGGCKWVCYNPGERSTAGISGTGPAGTSSCPNTLVAISVTGDACGGVAVSGVGNADGSAYEVSGKEQSCATAGVMC